MAISLNDITTGTKQRPPRIVILGTEKSGKTTFASGAPSPIFLPIKGEEGVDACDVAAFPTATKFSEVREALGVLWKEDHDFKTVVIDSASTLEPLIWDEACAQNGADSIEKIGGGFGKGYIEAVKQWRSIMDGLDALRAKKNMASIVIGHVTQKMEENPVAGTYSSYHFDIHKRASEALLRWADCILFANTQTYVKTEDIGFNKEVKRAISGGHKLYTGRNPARPGGGRGVYGQLPEELDLSWGAFQAAVSAALGAQ